MNSLEDFYIQLYLTKGTLIDEQYTGEPKPVLALNKTRFPPPPLHYLNILLFIHRLKLSRALLMRLPNPFTPFLHVILKYTTTPQYTQLSALLLLEVP